MARNKYDIDETLEKDAEFDLKHLARLKKYITPYKATLIKSIIVMLASSLLGMAGPAILGVAIDVAIPERNVWLVIGLSFGLLATLVINVVFVRYKIISMSKVGQGVIRDLRLDLFKHLQELPFNYYDSRPHGKILVRVVNYVNSLSDMLSNGLVNLVTDLFSLLVILVFMLVMDVRLTLFSMAGIPLLLFITNVIKSRQRVAWRKNSAKSSNMNAYIHESIAGMKVTQAFTREEKNRSIFKTVTGEVRQTWVKAIGIMFTMGPSAENISMWTTSLLYIAGVLWITGDMVTTGFIIAFTSYASRFWGPINNIANFYNSIVVNMTYLERIFEAIDEPTVVNDIDGATIMPKISGEVEFKNVTFGYEPEKTILKDVSFKVSPGDTIALVGPTGAGKTTVINLISRFYDLNSGTLLIDGTDIHGVTLNSLRSQMGIMLQDSFIFSGTIMDNIRYGKLDATDEEVMEAAKTVCAHDFIMEMEDGYKTEVNERGSRLSVGQRQLISFARALLADPKILILDEATSSIDTKTEKLLQEGLDKLLQGRTSFIIAHRLSTIQNSTTIMYIDKGTVLESGNHEQLLAKKGAYYELYTAQYAFLEAI